MFRFESVRPYKQMSKDKCVFVKSESNQISYCANTVDDCFFVATRNQEWIQSQVDMLQIAFEELTLERGEVINILGTTVHMERTKREQRLSKRVSWIS